ncbi:hypothetical protein D3C87_363780 [compost metagenome]
MSKLQQLKDELDAIGTGLRNDGVYFRLIMTDDIDNMADIRERAKAGLNWLGKVDKENGFFYGQCIRQNFQDRIDNLVRNFKPQLLEVINGGEPNWAEFGIDVIDDKAQKAYLIILNRCCAGFYLSERIHTPRHERRQRTSLQDVTHRALMTPKPAPSHEKASGRRKKFTTIRHHVN